MSGWNASRPTWDPEGGVSDSTPGFPDPEDHGRPGNGRHSYGQPGRQGQSAQPSFPGYDPEDLWPQDQGEGGYGRRRQRAARLQRPAPLRHASLPGAPARGLPAGGLGPAQPAVRAAGPRATQPHGPARGRDRPERRGPGVRRPGLRRAHGSRLAGLLRAAAGQARLRPAWPAASLGASADPAAPGARAVPGARAGLSWPARLPRSGAPARRPAAGHAAGWPGSPEAAHRTAAGVPRSPVLPGTVGVPAVPIAVGAALGERARPGRPRGSLGHASPAPGFPLREPCGSRPRHPRLAARQPRLAARQPQQGVHRRRSSRRARHRRRGVPGAPQARRDAHERHAADHGTTADHPEREPPGQRAGRPARDGHGLHAEHTGHRRRLPQAGDGPELGHQHRHRHRPVRPRTGGQLRRQGHRPGLRLLPAVQRPGDELRGVRGHVQPRQGARQPGPGRPGRSDLPAGTHGGDLACIPSAGTPGGTVCVWVTTTTLGVTEFFASTGAPENVTDQPKAAQDTVNFRADAEAAKS